MSVRCKGPNSGRRTNKAINMPNSRTKRTDEQIQQKKKKENLCVSVSQLRASQSQEIWV
jgi:hypothetical protein